MEDEVLERNRNLNRGFRKLEVWREAIQLYAFEKKALDSLKNISFKIKDQVLDSGFSISSNIAEGYWLQSGEIKRDVFDEFDEKHHRIENKLMNLAKALSKKMKPGQDWDSNYKV